ncbi:ATP-binding protein [Fodinicola feengrottensis]|uniref:ATP-binding protein n=1 Tax=Fodinicola feengrottensis TaxID=435914 RepID=UPI0031D28869
MTLVERDVLVERLGAVSAAARRGAGSLVAVAGEAGVGKTSLVREFFGSEQAVWGFCEPLSTPRPLGPFQDIARQIWPAEQDFDVDDMRERLLAWVRRTPTPLVVEDAHWIDDASADVLRFIGRRIDTSAGLLVVTYRDEVDGDHPLRRVLGDLASAAGVTRVTVPPLTRAGVAEMVSETEIDAAEAYRLTNGNAFLVSQLLLAPDGRVAASTRDAVAARVARLSPSARGVVELLSVIAGRVGAELLGADWSRLDEPVVAGLLRVDGAVVEFRHELVRLAVEQALTPGQRQDLHADVVRRMVAQGDIAPATIAYHARHAHELELAFTSQRAAAERAVALGAHREAAEHYHQAAADGAGLASQTELARLWLAASQEAYLVGRDEQALATAQRAVELCPLQEPLLRGEALWWLSRVTPADAESHRLALAAVEILEPLGPSPDLAAALAHLGTNRMLARDLTAGIALSRQAVDLASEVGDQASLTCALQALGSGLTITGQDPSCAHLWRAVQVAKEAGLDGELGRAYANLISAAGEARLYDASMAAIPEALDFYVARDLDGHASYAHSWYARCLFEQGRWSEAARWVTEALARLVEPRAITGIVAWSIQGRLRARRGDPQVWEPLDEAKRIADISGSLQRLTPVMAARAEARWLAGVRDDGASGLRQAYELAVERSNAWSIGELGLWMWRHQLIDAVPAAAAEPYRLQVDADPVGAGRAWTELGCPYEAADAWCDSDDAVVVRDALDRFTELGARPGRLRAARKLRELGVRSIPRGPRVSTAATPDGLTAREQEVRTWIVAGHTDAEIAAGLHLSIRTVGHHVSAVLRKTGARSRRELRRRTS